MTHGLISFISVCTTTREGINMKKIIIPMYLVFCIVFAGTVFADVPNLIPISAEDAFDAVQTQTDPLSGVSKNVALVDVRTRAEYFWIGAACQVDEIITTNGKVYYPDRGKVLLSRNGRFLNFDLNGKFRRLRVRKVSEVFMSPIAKNIPFSLWVDNPQPGESFLKSNPHFADDVNALADDYEVLIFFCGNGKRSGLSVDYFDTHLFKAIYEIDQPDGENKMGGFAGNSYGNVYNGYNGFPKRRTKIQEHPSVSWKDAGLPIRTLEYP